MFDLLSSRSLRCMCVALCVAALPLSGCPEEEENNKTTTDMGASPADMTPVDMGTTDMVVIPDAGMTPDADMVVIPDADMTPDAAMMCTNGSTQCATNDQCAATERCESVEGSVTGCCRVGVRGTKVAGDECTSGDECVSSLCVDSTQDPDDDDMAVNYCSVECFNETTMMPDSSMCPTQLPKCNNALAICIPE